MSAAMYSRTGCLEGCSLGLWSVVCPLGSGASGLNMLDRQKN